MVKQKNAPKKNKEKKGKINIASLIISAVATFCTISGITIFSVYNDVTSGKYVTEPNSIILFSEYSKITIYQETNIIATLNFETDSVSITAYLASGKSDTLSMNQKNSTEWEEKVIFNETGTHKIVATAIDCDGNEISDTISIEVIPMSINLENIFSALS